MKSPRPPRACSGEILVESGATVAVGTLLAALKEGGDKAKPPKAEAKSQPAQPAPERAPSQPLKRPGRRKCPAATASGSSEGDDRGWP